MSNLTDKFRELLSSDLVTAMSRLPPAVAKELQRALALGTSEPRPDTTAPSEANKARKNEPHLYNPWVTPTPRDSFEQLLRETLHFGTVDEAVQTLGNFQDLYSDQVQKESPERTWAIIIRAMVGLWRARRSHPESARVFALWLASRFLEIAENPGPADLKRHYVRQVDDAMRQQKTYILVRHGSH